MHGQNNQSHTVIVFKAVSTDRIVITFVNLNISEQMCNVASMASCYILWLVVALVSPYKTDMSGRSVS